MSRSANGNGRDRFVAGVDSSTQSCTVELRRVDSGLVAGIGRAPHPPTTPPVSEQHPESWWRAFVAAFGAACRDAGADPADVSAMAVGAQCHGLVVLDAGGEVIRPAKLWNDTTSAPEAAALVDALGTDGWVGAIGLRPTAALTITKLAWLAAHEPASLRRLAAVLLPHDYLTFRLTGRRVTDRSDASGTGYFGLDGTWRSDLLERFVSTAVDWEAALPEVLGPQRPAGTVARSVAEQLGLGDSVIVGPGGGDQHLGALGLGLGVGDVAVSLGTSGVVMSPSVAPVLDRDGWIDSVADAAGGFLPLVCTLNATKVTDTVARLLGIGLDELGALALAADPRAPRPTLVAHLDGERSPPRPGARGVLGGLTTATSRHQVALAAFEGVLFGLALGLERLRAHGLDAGRDVVVTGGGAASAAYRQVLADVAGRAVQTRHAPEATARGAAVQAVAVLTASTVAEVRDAWTPAPTSTTEPRAVAAGVPERYRELAELDAGRAETLGRGEPVLA